MSCNHKSPSVCQPTWLSFAENDGCQLFCNYIIKKCTLTTVRRGIFKYIYVYYFSLVTGVSCSIDSAKSIVINLHRMHKAPLHIHLSSSDFFLIRAYPSSGWERGRNTPWTVHQPTKFTWRANSEPQINLIFWFLHWSSINTDEICKFHVDIHGPGSNLLSFFVSSSIWITLACGWKAN